MTTELSPGEARTRKRQRRELIRLANAALMGVAVGFLVAFADRGDGNLFTGGWDKLVLHPAMAIGLAIAMIIGLIIWPIWAIRESDELVRERNYIAYAGGGIAVTGIVPAWALLHGGGLVPAPSAPGVWAMCFVVTMGTLAFAWLRDR